jgi:hypothetical protein
METSPGPYDFGSLRFQCENGGMISSVSSHQVF